MSWFPFFADLNDKPVLLVGAGEVATRKAESLLAAGAQLRVVARTLAPAFERWLQEGRIAWLGRTFSPAHLDGVFLVTSATGDAAVDAEVFAAASARQVFCNTVDSPEHCSFIVPAVVDRGPLQVAISSGATAPVLARYWRQKIEVMLPQHTGALATLAGQWRRRVQARLSGMRARRRFWEHIFSGPVNTLVAQGQLEAASQFLAAQLEASASIETPVNRAETATHTASMSPDIADPALSASGHDAPETFLTSRRPAEQRAAEQPPVTPAPIPALHTGDLVVVDAGSSDPGQLTLHALRALQAADLVVHDPALADGIRQQIRKDAEKLALPDGNGAGTAPAHPVLHRWSTPMDLAQPHTFGSLIPAPAGVPCATHAASHHAESAHAPHAAASALHTQRLVDEARRGKRVVWLRGGCHDARINHLATAHTPAQAAPRLVMLLQQAGVPWRHVPGVSAAPATPWRNTGESTAAMSTAVPAVHVPSVAKTQRPQRLAA